MFSIGVMILLIVVFVVVAVAAYKMVYTYKINKQIQTGEMTGIKLVDMSKMLMITVIAGLVMCCAILMYTVHDYASQTHTVTSRNDCAIIDVSEEGNYQYISYWGNQALNDASFAKVYNKSANEGYEKEVIESGDYVFTVFTRTSVADHFHPDFLCFVDYIGQNTEEYVCLEKNGFSSLVEDNGGFYGESIGDINKNLLYIGNLEADCGYDIQISILDRDAEEAYNKAVQEAYDGDKGIFPKGEEYAISTAKVRIAIP